MPAIRPADLPEGTLTSTAALIADTGAGVIKVTPTELVDLARPNASQAEALAGTDNSKSMTPLRVAQAVTDAVSQLPQLSTSDGAEKVGYGSGTVQDALELTLSRLGVPNSTGDVSAKLFAALADAAEIAQSTGRKVTLIGDSEAFYRHDGQLLFENVSFDGRNCTFVAGSNGTNDIRVRGDGVRIANLHHLGAALTRGNGANELNGLTGQNATNLLIENVEIGSAGTSGSQVYGFAAAGMLFVNCNGVIIRNPRVLNTYADGIHFTRNSKNAEIYAPYVYRSGDDGIAMAVSYIQDPGIVENIKLFGGLIVEPKARGVSVVGGRGCHAYGPVVVRSSAAAFYHASEAGDFNTHGVTDASVERGRAIGCVTGVGLDANFSQAVCQILGRGGSGTLDGQPVDFLTRNCSIQAFVDGVGARATAPGDNSNGFNLRSVLDLTLRNTEGTGAFFPVGVKMGGYNPRVRLSGDRSGGHLVDVVGGNLNQVGRIEFVGFDTVRTQNDPINAAIYTEGPSSQCTALYLTGEIVSAPATPIIDNGGFGSKIRKRDFFYNGSEVTS